jgi:hypothetical protein
MHALKIADSMLNACVVTLFPPLPPQSTHAHLLHDVGEQVVAQLRSSFRRGMLRWAGHAAIVPQRAKREVVDVDPNGASPVGGIMGGVAGLVEGAGAGEGAEAIGGPEDLQGRAGWRVAE